MWAETLLRKFFRRPATLYLIGNELHIVFDPFQGQDDLCLVGNPFDVQFL